MLTTGPTPDVDVFNVMTAVEIAPKSYFVLGTNDDEKLNGGVKVHLKLNETFKLRNVGKDGVIIMLDGTLIDEVIYDTKGGWPFLNGRSMNLAAGKLNDKVNVTSHLH